MAINNLTELVKVLEQDPTLASINVTRNGTSVTELRLNPISSGIQSTSQTSTVTVSPVTVPTIVDTVIVDNISDNDQGITNEQLLTSIDGRLTVVENVVIDVEASVLDNSVLTGIPTAPTAAAGTNTTQIATTAFVTGAITTLVDGAPGALDTLNELSAALNNDSDFAVTVTETLALKAPLDSPSFTGTVSMSTPLDIASGGTGGSSTTTALNNLLPSGETAGYVLKTNGPGSYFWDAETGASLIVGTRINTSRTFYTATEGQTLFTGVGEYTPGAGQLRVYLDGVRQFDSEYTETSSTSFTLDVGVPSGTIVLAEVDGFVSYPVTANAVSVTPTGGISATDVQNALAGLDGRSFIAGMIIMWSGTIANIPSGWALCDGTGGTPDLRNRMIIGANADDAGAAKTNVTGTATQTGGSKDAIVVSHSHTITDPGHFHAYTRDTGIAIATSGGGSYPVAQTSANTDTKTTGITIDSEGSSGTNANLPPYYALAFIMKL